MASNEIKYDDPFNFVRAVQDGSTVVVYPFLQNGDRGTRIIRRSLLQREENYQVMTPGTEKDNVWPGGDPNAYSLPDSPPEPVGIGDLVRFQRGYARIPVQQVTYPGSRYFNLPTVDNEFDGLSSMVVTNYPINSAAGLGYYNVTSDVIYLENNNQLYGPVVTLGNKTVGRATAGTFTLTYGANTTAALNWNDSNATINAAINGLASIVAAGLTASVGNSLSSTSGGTLTTTWTAGSTLTAMTMNAGGLTLTTSKNPTTQIPNTSAQVIRIPDHFVATSHGLDTASSLAVVRANDSMLLYATANWGSIDANTIWIPTNFSIGDAKFVADFNRTYTPGRLYLLRTKLVEDFFLPGVSAGITTAADIPIDLGLQAPSDFINALLTLTGWQTYETEGPAFWMDGPIYRRAYTQINLTDIT